MASKKKKNNSRKQDKSGSPEKPKGPEEAIDKTLAVPETGDSAGASSPASSESNSTEESFGTLSAEDSFGTLPVPEKPDNPPDSQQDEMESSAATEETTQFVEGSGKQAHEVDVNATNPVPAENSVGENTAAYNTGDLKEILSGDMDTDEKLKREWLRGLGSSHNVESSIVQGRPLASDSVFERVAKRLLVTDTAAQISESFDKQDSTGRERVKDLIEHACQGGDSENADYNLKEIVGKGGMGIVLKAVQTAIGRDVALKILQPSKDGTTAPRVKQREFFYEAQITGRLDHPNIVPVYELGESNGVFFYSMKLIDGKEWKDLMGKQSLEDKLDTWMKLADAVAFAHDKGIIHLDLKPANVMIGPFGEVLLTDWGLAVDLKRKDSEVTTGGSLPYMAPEVAKKQKDRIGTRTDIYLLGAIFYELLTGNAPHKYRTVAMCLDSARKNNFRAPDLLEPLLEPLMEIAKRAMMTEPRDRYLTVGDMQADIRQYERHAESIRDADDSYKMLSEAKSSHDFQLYSKAILGFERAIKRWDGNKYAKEGLDKARLAYAESAYERGNFDLCMSTLSAAVPEEAELFAKAAKAKKAAEQRDQRIKNLRIAVAAVLLIGIGATSFAAFLAYGQMLVARAQTVIAQEETKRANNETKRANDQTLIAENNATEALRQKGIAEDNANEALRQQGFAEDNANEANRQKLIAEANEKTANEQTEIAKKQTKLAIENEAEAFRQRGIAEYRAADVELKTYLARLGQAFGSVDRSVQTAAAYLDELKEQGSFETLLKLGGRPRIENWAWRRTDLLTNRELVGNRLGTQAIAVVFAQNKNRGAVATKTDNGYQLQIIELVGNLISPSATFKTQPLPASVDGLAITPDGDELIYSLATGGEQSTVHSWKLDGVGEPKPVAQAKQKSLQGFVVSDDAVVGGINGGLLVWKRTLPHWQDSDPTTILNLGGRLKSIQLVGSYALVLSERNGRATIYWTQLSAGAAKPTEVIIKAAEAGEFEPRRLTAVAYAQGKLILGTADGQLFSAVAVPGSQQVNSAILEIGPRQHRAAITSIQADPTDATLVTKASEPAAQVWKTAATPSGWQHYTFLAGTPSNVGAIAFMQSSAHVLGIGEEGRPIMWDVERQKQRRQLVPLDMDREPFEYRSPVVDTVIADDNQRAVSILQDGSIHTWNPVTGETILSDSQPISYIGHAPGSTFVDMGIDEQSGTLLTSAKLPLLDENLTVSLYEFCKWDLQTGMIIDRWMNARDVEPVISLFDEGRMALYASYNKTLLEETNRQSKVRRTVTPSGNDFPSFLALENPKTPHLLMTVRYGEGDLRVIDTSNTSNNNVVANFKAPGGRGEIVTDCVWSPAGDRFFIIWRKGRITQLSWQNNQLALVNEAKFNLDLGFVTRNQLDLKVRDDGSDNIISLAIESAAQPRLLRAKFPKLDGEPELTMLSPANKGSIGVERSLVLTDDDTPTLELQPKAILPFSDRGVVATKRIGQTSYLATNVGNVYRISHENGQVRLVSSFASTPILSGSGNRSADRIVTLHEGGLMRRADWLDDKWVWSPLPDSPSAADVIMSPDGKQFLLCHRVEQRLQIANAETGEVIESLENAICGVWNRAGDLAVVKSDKTIQLRTAGETVFVEKGQLHESTTPESVRSLHFFTEAWQKEENKENKEPIHWLLVHAQPAGESTVEYIAIDKPADLAALTALENPPTIGSDAAADGDAARQIDAEAKVGGKPAVNSEPFKIGEATVVACSPTEGILVTGSRDSVIVRFATPSLNEFGEELFSLEGHAGAQIRSLVFSSDGNTLITTDSLNRVFGWMSSDPLHGMATSLKTD